MSTLRAFSLLLVALAFVLASSESLTAQPPPTEIDCVDCSVCATGGEPGNKAPLGDHTSLQDVGEGKHKHCVGSGGCDENHPLNVWCPGFGSEDAENVLALLEAVMQAVDAGDPVRARGMVQAAGNAYVRFVPERNAIQAYGCKASIIAHIPLWAASPTAVNASPDAATGRTPPSGG